MDENMVFHEVYGTLPDWLLRTIKFYNVTQSDWDAMLARWGYQWDSPDIPFRAVQDHIETHSQRGYYQYPLYG